MINLNSSITRLTRFLLRFRLPTTLLYLCLSTKEIIKNHFHRPDLLISCERIIINSSIFSKIRIASLTVRFKLSTIDKRNTFLHILYDELRSNRRFILQENLYTFLYIHDFIKTFPKCILQSHLFHIKATYPIGRLD